MDISGLGFSLTNTLSYTFQLQPKENCFPFDLSVKSECSLYFPSGELLVVLFLNLVPLLNDVVALLSVLGSS